MARRRSRLSIQLSNADTESLLSGKCDSNDLTNPWEAALKWSQRRIRQYVAESSDTESNTTEDYDDLPLKRIISAKYNDSQCAVKSSCESGTRRETLQAVYKWLELDSAYSSSQTGKRFFWTHGLAGSGKSTIARSIAEYCEGKGVLGATFFCSQHNADCSDISNIIPTLSYQLCQLNNSFRLKVLEAFDQNEDLNRSDITAQLRALIVEPLRTAKQINNFVIIIDALDECVDESSTFTLLEALSKHRADLEPLKFFITSRPEPNIRKAFYTLSLCDTSYSCDLNKLSETQTSTDIRLFFNSRLRNIGYEAAQIWPSDEELNNLVERAAGSFAFASAMVKYIEDDGEHDHYTRLTNLLASTTSSPDLPYAYLDNTYLQILESKFDECSSSLADKVCRVLGVLITAAEPLSLNHLEWLLPAIPVCDVLRDLRSLIWIPDDDNEPIRFIHPSLRDFFMSEKRCSDRRFLVETHHSLFAQRCVERILLFTSSNSDANSYLSQPSLKGLDSLRIVLQRTVDPRLRYAHMYWRWHITRLGIRSLEDMAHTPLMTFLSNPRIIHLFALNDGSPEYSLHGWAKDILLGFLTSSLSKFRSRLSTSIYNSILFIFGKHYRHKLLPLSFSKFSVSKTSTDKITERLVEANELFSNKFFCSQATFGLDQTSVRLEILFVYLRYEISEDGIDQEVNDDVIQLLKSVSRNDSKRDDMRIITSAFLAELEFGFHQRDSFVSLSRSLRKLRCGTPKPLLTDVPNVIQRYRSLLHYISDCDRSLSGLYSAALEAFRKQYNTVNSNDTFVNGLQATLQTLFMSPKVVNLKELSALMSLMAFHPHAALTALSEAHSVLIFALSPANGLPLHISEQTDVDTFSYNENEVCSIQKPANMTPECQHYKQVLLRKDRCSDHRVYKAFSEHVFLDYTSIIRMTDGSSCAPEDGVSVDTYKFRQAIARCCLEKVTQFIRGMNGHYYRDQVSGTGCIDLWSNRRDFMSSAGSDVVQYAWSHWQTHLRDCIHDANESLLESLHDFLSLRHGLLHCTGELKRSEMAAFCIDLFDALSVRESAPKKLMISLYEVLVYFHMSDWTFRVRRDKVIHQSVRRMDEIRRLLREKYLYSDGLYELDTRFPYLQLALLIYRDAYIRTPENDIDMVQKSRNLRDLASQVHDMISRHHVPENTHADALLQECMSILYRTLEDKSSTCFSIYTTVEHENHEKMFKLESAIDACHHSLQVFHDNITKILKTSLPQPESLFVKRKRAILENLEMKASVNINCSYERELEVEIFKKQCLMWVW